MRTLEEYLQERFGGARKGGRRLVALSEVHALHECGYDVAYTRYCLTYREIGRELDIAAELDEEGELVVQGRGLPRRVRARIVAALRCLGVGHTFA